jgi:REP element-mobilizing transposase RayT
VFPAKYRKAVFDEQVDSLLKEVYLEMEKRYEIKFVEIGVDKDHVHFLVQSVPTYSVTRIVTMIKSTNSKMKRIFISYSYSDWLITERFVYFLLAVFFTLSILPVPTSAQTEPITVGAKNKATLQLMLKGVRQPKLKCQLKEDQNTYFELSCDKGIETVTDLEGDCYANSLEERWGKDCRTYSRITFTEDYSIFQKGDYLILVNQDEDGIEQTEGVVFACGRNRSFAMISRSEELRYEALFFFEKQEYVNTPDCLEYLRKKGFI